MKHRLKQFMVGALAWMGVLTIIFIIMLSTISYWASRETTDLRYWYVNNKAVENPAAYGEAVEKAMADGVLTNGEWAQISALEDKVRQEENQKIKQIIIDKYKAKQ